jgi:N-acetylglutamate synthase-like GNAT family acetyltransferase
MSQWQRNGYVISTEKQFLDTNAIYYFLSAESYWAKGITRESILKSIESSSICFGLYEGNPEMGKAKQVGFVRVVTDFVRFAYIMDVFVVDTYRGKGLSKWLMEIVTEQSDLKDVSSMLLCTNDAHGLYAQYGFEKIENPEKYMVRKKC